MSDARKRARSKAGDATGPGRKGVPPVPEPEAPASVPETDQWLSRDEPLVFPADPPTAGRPARIALPSSGLAADILARADAATVEALPIPEAAPVPAPMAPSESPRTHNVSFFAAPVREERKTVESTEHLATFLLGGEEYGVDVRLVQEIIRVTEITPVPRAPEFIKGVINLRGRIIPVIDLKRKLSLGDVQPSRVARIVVVKMKDRLIGLLVDGASQVLKVPLSTIEAAPEEVVEIDAHYIRGVAKLPDRLVILMDLQRILAPELREGVDVGPA